MIKYNNGEDKTLICKNRVQIFHTVSICGFKMYDFSKLEQATLKICDIQ